MARNLGVLQHRDSLSTLLGVLEEAALPDVLHFAEAMRSWHLKLCPPAAQPATPSAAAAAAAAALRGTPARPSAKAPPGAAAAGAAGDTRGSGGEFGADLVVHAARLAGDPDAAVLAMCGELPGTAGFVDR